MRCNSPLIAPVKQKDFKISFLNTRAQVIAYNLLALTNLNANTGAICICRISSVLKSSPYQTKSLIGTKIWTTFCENRD